MHITFKLSKMNDMKTSKISMVDNSGKISVSVPWEENFYYYWKHCTVDNVFIVYYQDSICYYSTTGKLIRRDFECHPENMYFHDSAEITHMNEVIFEAEFYEDIRAVKMFMNHIEVEIASIFSPSVISRTVKIDRF